MYRGILQLTKEELKELIRVFHWDTNGTSIIASKLKVASENSDEIKNISVSEEDLEYLLDDIMPIEQNNLLLKNVFEKISEQLREIRELRA